VKDKACKFCKGTGYMDSQVRSSVLRTKGGDFLRLKTAVPIHTPCPKCKPKKEQG